MNGIDSAWPSIGWRRSLGRIVLALSLTVAVAGALAPQPAMAWLREAIPGFATAWDWLDASLPWFNPLHAIVFAWLAWLWQELISRRSRWRMPVALIGMGVVCEWLQHFVPGRQPRVSDVVSDALGIAIGAALAATIEFVRGRR